MTAATSEMVAKLKASAAKPQYDVVMLSGVGAFELANAGILEKPDPSKIPNHSQVPQNLRFGANGFGVGYYLWVDAMWFNTKTFSKAPTSFEVLWDKKYAGKVFIPPPQWTEAQQLVILAAEMAGGDVRNPEPGFKKLAELKPQIMLLGENIAQVVDLFRTNSLVVGGPYSPSNGLKFFPNAQYNLSATMNLKQGFFCDLQFMIIPKGHPGDTDVIHAFINYALDPKVQGLMAEEVAYGPINEKTVLSGKARKSGYIPTPELVKEKGRFIDNEYLAKVRPEWIKRYTEIFGF
jgi:putative spermidine/putrescine transport system substrate-binding protein